MKKSIRKVAFLAGSLVATVISSSASLEKTASAEIQPMVVQQFFEEAKKNTNWKMAFATGKSEQIVFMNISPFTNPNNEIGVEVHSFDQVILIVEGKGKVEMNGKMTMVKNGDMIFIPEGTSHNVINLAQNKALKLISFYSDTDIPNGAIYKKKADHIED